MVNVTYDASGSLVATPASTGEAVVYDLGDMAWVLASSALVMIMTPGVGFFYSGLLRRKNALSMIYLSMAIYAVVTVTWFFWGFSLAFGQGSKFIGNLDNFGLINVLDDPSVGSTRIPSLLYMFYQSMFAAITPMLAFGAVAERGRLGPVLLVVFIWITIVYCPIACWTWNPSGWSFIMGALDFAGGGPVHMNSGAAALAYSIWLGKRRGYGTAKLAYKPHNVTHVVLGTVFLWFGWFGFNGGSALSANLRAVQASVVTNVAASMAGLTWVMLDWRLEKKWSAVGLCSGIIAGLVGITPAAGYVGTPASLAIGFVTAICCNFATKLKFIFGYDDTLDIFAVHGVGGFVGSLMTGLFADSRVTGFDGITAIPGGWLNQNYIQLGYQLADAVAILGYSFTVTMIIIIIVDYIPGCSLRLSEEGEIVGTDEYDMGELGYDYAFIEREIEHHYQESEGDTASLKQRHPISEEKNLSPAADAVLSHPTTGLDAPPHASNAREAPPHSADMV